MNHSIVRGPDFLRAVVAALPWLSACDSDGGVPELPAFFRLEGSAELESGNDTLTCHIDYIVELSGEVMRTDAFVEYTGTMGGGAGRSLLDPDGAGWGLFGDAFSFVRVRLTYPDAVIIESTSLPPSRGHDPPSFWEEISNFEGTFGPGDLIAGEWLCAPFFTDLGGFADETLFADGTWFTETIEN